MKIKAIGFFDFFLIFLVFFIYFNNISNINSLSIKAIKKDDSNKEQFNNMLNGGLDIQKELLSRYGYTNKKSKNNGKNKLVAVNFKSINLHLLDSDDDLFKNKSINKNKQEIKKMQNLALFVKNKYNISLNFAEEIILATFRESHIYSIPPTLMLSLISVESNFKKFAKSNAGAVGLTQIIPKWHKNRISNAINKKGGDIWTTHNNIAIGANILNEYYAQSNYDMVIALQKYNGSLYDKSRKYSKKVINNKFLFDNIGLKNQVILN